MDILALLIIGGVAGWVATMLLKEDWRYGFVANILLGAIGAFVGSWILGFLGGPQFTGFNIGSFVAALVGAIVLILGARALRGERVA